MVLFGGYEALTSRLARDIGQRPKTTPFSHLIEIKHTVSMHVKNNLGLLTFVFLGLAVLDKYHPEKKLIVGSRTIACS